MSEIFIKRKAAFICEKSYPAKVINKSFYTHPKCGRIVGRLVGADVRYVTNARNCGGNVGCCDNVSSKSVLDDKPECDER